MPRHALQQWLALGEVARLHRDVSGIVYAEFLLAFMPIFTLFLGIIQLTFIGASSLVVQNAAMKGARAAMVVLPDDPFFYEGEDVLTLDFDGESDDSKMVDGVASKVAEGGIEREDEGEGRTPGAGGPRLNQIRFAVNVALAPIGPQPQLLASWMPEGFGISRPQLGLRKGTIGMNPALRFFTGLLVYNPMAAAINFPKAPESKELRNFGEDFDGSVVYASDDSVTVRVTYLYPCTVPLVSRLICRSIYPGPGGLAARTKRWVDAVGDGGQGLRDRLKARGQDAWGYAGDQWEGAKEDARKTINGPRDAVMNAAKCVRSEAVGFVDGIREEAFTLRDGVLSDLKGLRDGLRNDANAMRDGVIADARGLIDGTRADGTGLGRGLVTDGKNLAGGLRADARNGVRALEAEGARVRDELVRNGKDVGRGLGSEVDELNAGLAQDGRDALGELPGLGDIDDLQGPVDRTAQAGKDVGHGVKDLYGVGEDVYRLGQTPYDPFQAAATIGRAGETVGNVVETTDDAGRRVVVGLNETGRQVVKTYDAAGGVVTQTVDQAGNLVVVTVDAGKRRVETTLDRAGNRIERGVDDAGRQVIVARDHGGKIIRTTIDGMGNQVVESVDQAQNRVITTIDSLGNRTVTTIDAAGRRVDNAYTSATTRIESTYENGTVRTRTAYDDGVKRYESTISGIDECTETGYDALGKQLDNPAQAFTDRANNIQGGVTQAIDKFTNNWRDELFGGLRAMTDEEKGLMDELHAGTTQPELLDTLLMGDNARFYVLRREATLPLQTAHYRYPTWKKFKDKDKDKRADARD
jgi:hypothetical protein